MFHNLQHISSGCQSNQKRGRRQIEQSLPKAIALPPARAYIHRPLWASLGHFGPLWASLGLSGPLWASLGVSGPLSGPLWASLGLSGFCTYIRTYIHMYICIHKYVHTYIHMYIKIKRQKPTAGASVFLGARSWQTTIPHNTYIPDSWSPSVLQAK